MCIIEKQIAAHCNEKDFLEFCPECEEELEEKSRRGEGTWLECKNEQCDFILDI